MFCNGTADAAIVTTYEELKPFFFVQITTIIGAGKVSMVWLLSTNW